MNTVTLSTTVSGLTTKLSSPEVIDVPAKARSLTLPRHR